MSPASLLPAGLEEDPDVLDDDEWSGEARLAIVLRGQSEHLPPPHLLGLGRDLVVHRGEDGDEEVEEHHVTDQEVHAEKERDDF